MDQPVAIEDVFLPFRAYAWAVTGSVSLADELLIKCFEDIVRTMPDALPTTKTEWFDQMDGVVVDWVSSRQGHAVPEHPMIAQTIRMIGTVEQDALRYLLSRSEAC